MRSRLLTTHGFSETSSSLKDGGRLLASEGALVAFGGCRWLVGGRRGDVHEEGARILPSAPDEVGGLPGEDIGEVVLGVAAVGDDLAVLVYLVTVGLVFSVSVLAAPLVPAGRDVSWVLVARVLVEVLAKESGLIAALLQPYGDGILLVPLRVKLVEAPVGGLVAYHVVVVGVETGENGSPGGATQRQAYKRLLKGGALVG